MKLHAAEQDADDVDDSEDLADHQDDGVEQEEAEENEEELSAADEGEEQEEQEEAEEKPRSKSAIEQHAERERLARERGELDGERRARDRAEAERAAREDQRREEELVATMTEEQRTSYLLAKEVKNTKQNQQQTNMLLHSSTDQNKFGRLLSRKPQYAKYEDEVEQRHQQILSQGGFTPRDLILKVIIGEKALAAESGTRVKEQKQQAQRRVQAQRGETRARGTRGDSGSRGTRSGETLAQRAERENWTI